MTAAGPRLTLAQARRAALAAQGLDRPRPQRTITMRDVQGIIDRLAQLQIDSINVLERAHYLPLFSRLGAYDKALLDRAAYAPPRRLFEYWGHAASLIDVRLEPALRWRMAGYAERHPWGYERHPVLAERWVEEITARGPLTSRDLSVDQDRRREHWGWNWSEAKQSLEFLHSAGTVAVAGRTRSFERLVDLPERVLPAAVLAAPTPTVAEAHVGLVRRAARALGVATTRCLADYFRLSQAHTRAAVTTLVASGELLPVTVDGWGPAFRWHGARVPRTVGTRTLLSPFDSMVFERSRVLALFGSHYRIEIYVPEPQRVFGYYTYLFCLDDQLRARVDLKADRRSGALVVRAAWLEPDNEVQGPQREPARVARELAAELHAVAGWQGLAGITVEARGDLHEELGRALG